MDEQSRQPVQGFNPWHVGRYSVIVEEQAEIVASHATYITSMLREESIVYVAYRYIHTDNVAPQLSCLKAALAHHYLPPVGRESQEE